MKFPDFYAEVPTIHLIDPLAEFLGSIDQGKIEFTFSDFVRMAGHGCPTVAGAYLLAFHGLQALYADEIPIRGNIEVWLKKDESQGTNGVIGNLLAYVTGASGVGGFKGLLGQFSRNNSLFYSSDITHDYILKLKGQNIGVGLSYHPEIVSSDPMVRTLLDELHEDFFNIDARKQFKLIWNQRMKKILIDEFYNPELIQVTKVFNFSK